MLTEKILFQNRGLAFYYPLRPPISIVYGILRLAFRAHLFDSNLEIYSDDSGDGADDEDKDGWLGQGSMSEDGNKTQGGDAAKSPPPQCTSTLPMDNMQHTYK